VQTTQDSGAALAGVQPGPSALRALAASPRASSRIKVRSHMDRLKELGGGAPVRTKDPRQGQDGYFRRARRVKRECSRLRAAPGDPRVIDHDDVGAPRKAIPDLKVVCLRCLRLRRGATETYGDLIHDAIEHRSEHSAKGMLCGRVATS